MVTKQFLIVKIVDIILDQIQPMKGSVMIRNGIFILTILCGGIFNACSSIALYDHYAYTEAVSLKVDALAVMDEATQPAANHQASIDGIKRRLQKMYEYERGRPKNEISTRMWKTMSDPDRKLLAGFIVRWENNQTLGDGFIEEAKTLIAEAFDLIISLESKKIKSDDAEKGFSKFWN